MTQPVLAFAKRAGILVTLLLALTFPRPSAAEQPLSCLTSSCHADLAAITMPHSPMADGDCLACHQQQNPEHPLKGGKSFTLVAKGAKLCYQCHDAMKGKTVHDPVREGECTACHNPHGTDHPNLLPVGDDLTALCQECHDSSLIEGQYVHGPTAVGACNQCHDPHQSTQPKLLKKPAKDLCIQCHTDMAEGLASAPYTHTAVKESSCTACHNPHSSAVPRLLKQSMPELCVTCHTEIGEKAQRSKVKHTAMYREQKCGACHSTHFSEYPGLLPAPQQEVCLSCHGQDDFSKSDALKNIRKELEGKKYLHGPLQEGECSACHDPHGSDNVRLLTGPYPASLYLPYKKGSYDFCLQCHDKNMLRFPDTSIYTEFRNGKQNLHYVHVANKWKGRTCRACHAPHASNLENLISEDGVKFGDWNIPTRYQKTETGGSCAPGCHRSYSYDRKTPVNYEQE